MNKITKNNKNTLVENLKMIDKNPFDFRHITHKTFDIVIYALKKTPYNLNFIKNFTSFSRKELLEIILTYQILDKFQSKILYTLNKQELLEMIKKDLYI